MLCSCGSEAVYERIHEGNAYCASCLSHQVEETCYRTVVHEHLIEKGDCVIVGVSGGKDSAVLLALLKKLQDALPFSLKALAVNEGIAGYRNESLSVARHWCATLGIEYETVSFPAGHELDAFARRKHCTYCGVLRRSLLNKGARELGATKLALGHNADDESQSILMNVLNGDVTRFERLGARPPSRGDRFVPRIKPLRNIMEKEIVAYALVNKVPFYRSECPYSHDNVRRDVLEVINALEQKRPGTKMKILGFYDGLRQQRDVRSNSLSHCLSCGEPS